MVSFGREHAPRASDQVIAAVALLAAVALAQRAQHQTALLYVEPAAAAAG
jgi:hypothetical protein